MSARAYQRADKYGVLAKIWEHADREYTKGVGADGGHQSNGGLAHMFGSGHSVLPVQDMFPRYGSYPGFRPLMDMRLMWTNVIGSGGAKGLLWLERREGYAQVLFENEPIRKGDVMLVFSHGGLNAVGIEVLVEAKKRGLTTVAVTSMDNYSNEMARILQARNSPTSPTSSSTIALQPKMPWYKSRIGKRRWPPDRPWHLSPSPCRSSRKWRQIWRPKDTCCRSLFPQMSWEFLQTK